MYTIRRSFVLLLAASAAITPLVISCISADRAKISGPQDRKIERPKINVMAPLVIGNPSDPDGAASQVAWEKFRNELGEIKKLGAYAVSTDVWWGFVEPEDNKFQWAYYDKLAREITAAGLKWVPIISTHQCGGNVGDECDIPLPSWIWTKYSSAESPVTNLQYVSEQGNASLEVVSAWMTHVVLSDYQELYAAFQKQFAAHAAAVTEINISLGPAGELRYPSYNVHDKDSGYPTRGAFQSYSRPAVISWLETAKKEKLPASASGLPPISMEKWLKTGQQRTNVGKRYVDWYQQSLYQHGKMLLTAAVSIFQQANAPFSAADIGAKIPGIHWRIGSVSDKGTLQFGDRFAELAAGLIPGDRPAWNKPGRGYDDIVKVFKEVDQAARPGSIVLHFTALEMEDGQDKPEVQSMARSLVNWVGDEAARQGVRIKGENALGWNIPNATAWVRMSSHIRSPENPRGLYEGLTVLRMSDVLGSTDAKAAFQKLALGN